MDRELLYRFFAGETSQEEDDRIEQWVKSSKDNYELFIEERKSYDLLLFNHPDDQIVIKNNFRMTPWQIGVAASLLIFFTGIIFYYNLTNNKLPYSSDHITKSTVEGQIKQILLPDSTRVWLNEMSSLRYPSKFDKNDRTVFLEGEAYFEVSKNEKSSFRVKGGVADILVTGTKFNVKAIDSISLFEALLVEGAIDIYKDDDKIESMKPNQKIEMVNNQFVLSNESSIIDHLWIEEIINFDNESLESVLNKLGKIYDFKIAVKPGKKFNQKYSGKFKQKYGIEYCLKILKQSFSFEYVINRDKKTISII